MIARYLELETENPENASIAITPANYQFRLKTRMTQGDSQIYVFELTPKQESGRIVQGRVVDGRRHRHAGEGIGTAGENALVVPEEVLRL